MRVPPDFLKSIVFLGAVTNVQKVAMGETAEMVFAGTGFWISVSAANGGSYTHLVASRHVVEKLQECTWGIRGNTKNGEAHIWATDDSVWYYHDDKTVDLAVLPWTPPPGEIEYTSIPQKSFATPGMTLLHRDTKEHLKQPVGVGDEVAIVGLLNYAPGEKINMPIARFGNLSLVPAEPIPWRGQMVNVYLVESRSIGGLSGSPVFIKVQSKSSGDIYFLLGVVRGHWDREAVNVGIALIEPSRLIEEILNKPELVEMRKNLDAEYSAYAERSSKLADAINDGVVLDSAPSTKADNPSHAEDFNRLLTSAGTGKKRDDQT